MKSLLRSAVALVATFTLGFAAVPDEVHQNLGKLVPEIVRLLEAKDFASVLETLVPPDEFKKITAEKPIAEFAKMFGEHNAAALLGALKAIKDVKPKISDDGNKAIFDLPENPAFPKKTMEFLRIGGRWYLK
ncbi:MAG: hypothetical protein ABI318_03075 [Chthoniobacteraceae bacterium]